MRKQLVLSLACLALFLGVARAGDRLEPTSTVGMLGQAEEVRLAAGSAYRTAENFTVPSTPAEGRAVRQLRNLERQAARFESVLKKDDDSKAVKTAFARLMQQYCTTADSLWRLDRFGAHGTPTGGHVFSNATRATDDFNRLAATMDSLMASFGYQGCGAYSHSGFGGRIGS